VKIDVITIFPEYLAPLRQSLLGKAVERGLVTCGSGPTTSTAPWTTPRTAEGQAW
jgi:tRNA G37 N-methylase TrmD